MYKKHATACIVIHPENEIHSCDKTSHWKVYT